MRVKTDSSSALFEKPSVVHARICSYQIASPNVAFRMGKLTHEEFWSGEWFGDLMRYRSLEKLWGGIRADPFIVSVSIPRTTETVGNYDCDFASRGFTGALHCPDPLAPRDFPDPL